MAKDGTSRGGARIGAGQKKKPLADKILEGNPGRRKLMVMEFTDTADLEGQSMPPPREYLAAKQKNGKATLAVEIYEKTWQWLKERRCEHLIPAQLIVEVNTKMHKKGLLKMSFSGTNFVLVVLKELSTYPWFYMTFL